MFNFRSPWFIVIAAVVLWIIVNYDQLVYQEPPTVQMVGSHDTGIRPIDKVAVQVVKTAVVDVNRVLSPALPSRISKRYKHINKVQAQALIAHVYKYSKKHRLDPVLVLGLIGAESSFNSASLSPSGAVGYTQVLPRWHADKIKDRDISNIAVNVQVGVRILSDCMHRRKNQRAALGCYNGATRKVDIDKYVNLVYAHVKNIERMVH